MTRIINISIAYRIRLDFSSSLIFFVLVILPGCRQNASREAAIIWKDSVAVGITIPASLVHKIESDSVSRKLNIFLAQERNTPLLGDLKLLEDHIEFFPPLPLQPGNAYDILYGNKVISTINVPSRIPSAGSTVIATYPSATTLPENLLKIYVQFSQPMREGESLQHMFLLNSKSDTVPGVFLELKPELWNKESTALTVWLDPGRIKRDLIPNKTLGNPLKRGEKYTLVISNTWTDAFGQPLSKSYLRQFTVVERDSISPQPDQWQLQLPTAGTQQPLVINTGESLDYFLLQETIGILSPAGEKIPGSYTITNAESIIQFTPDKPWSQGKHRLRVAPFLEDLAGNNLKHVFDRDVTLKKTTPSEGVYQRVFEIR